MAGEAATCSGTPGPKHFLQSSPRTGTGQRAVQNCSWSVWLLGVGLSPMAQPTLSLWFSPGLTISHEEPWPLCFPLGALSPAVALMVMHRCLGCFSDSASLPCSLVIS